MKVAAPGPSHSFLTRSSKLSPERARANCPSWPSGDPLRSGYAYGYSPEFQQYKPVHILDALADAEFKFIEPVKIGGARMERTLVPLGRGSVSGRLRRKARSACLPAVAEHPGELV